MGANDQRYGCVYQREDSKGRVGVHLSKELMAIAGHALKANITTLGPLVLPISEQLIFFGNLVARKVRANPIQQPSCVCRQCKTAADASDSGIINRSMLPLMCLTPSAIMMALPSDASNSPWVTSQHIFLVPPVAYQECFAVRCNNRSNDESTVCNCRCSK